MSFVSDLILEDLFHLLEFKNKKEDIDVIPEQEKEFLKSMLLADYEYFKRIDHWEGRKIASDLLFKFFEMHTDRAFDIHGNELGE